MDWKRLGRGAALLVIAALVQAPVGLLATASLDAAIKNDGTRDALVGAVWIIVLLIGGAVALIGVWRLSGATATHAETPSGRAVVPYSTPGLAAPVTAPDPPPSPPATGETVVETVIGRMRYSVGPTTIDYYPTPNHFYLPDQQMVSANSEVRAFQSLKLGEVALIRRLAVAPAERQPSRRCTAVLHASGIAHPETSIGKLEDLGLIEADWEDMKLTERGRRLVFVSNQMLVHYADLVTAYRQVTPNINREIRFDGRTGE